MLKNFRFEDPWFLIILVFLIPVLWHLWRCYWGKSSSTARIRFSSLSSMKSLSFQKGLWFRRMIFLLRTAVFVLFLLAIMRPQTGSELTETKSEVVDTLLVLDTSGSMRALDFFIDKKRVTRLDAVKNVVAEFIQARPTDRMGMVVFGDEAYTQCPQTLDHGVLLSLLEDVEIGMAGDGTAIGKAIAVSAKRLKDLPAKSKVMILLTDGRNNSPLISPEQASEAARAFQIKIYTIGVGGKGKAPFLVDGFFGKQMVYQNVDLDEETLKKIANITGGKYFRATNTKALEEIYKEIDKLEKTEVDLKRFMEYEERFAGFVNLALILILLEIFLLNTRFQKIP